MKEQEALSCRRFILGFLSRARPHIKLIASLLQEKPSFLASRQLKCSFFTSYQQQAQQQ
jgi:hypothetical protein